MAAHHIDPQREIELRGTIENELAVNPGCIDLASAIKSDNDLFIVAELLKKDTRVRKLILSDNSITNRGAEAIADLLRYNKTIQSLDLSYNNIGDAGMQKVMHALQSSGTLIHLSFGTNKLSLDGIDTFFHLLTQIPHLTSLELSYSNTESEIQKKIAQKARENKTLLSFAYYGLDDEMLKPFLGVLKHNHTLQTLRFSHGEISYESARPLAEALKHNKNIQTLDLSHNYIDDQGARILTEAPKRHSKFTTLILNDSEMMTVNGINALNTKGKFTVITNPELKRKRNDSPECTPQEKHRKITIVGNLFSLLGQPASAQSGTSAKASKFDGPSL
ncbi:MAG: hypothetical protein K2Q33_03395 [Gammaproteobacteria bacterium]|nr:hypothetical protein [Gammaproteobacteria bacterium]